MQVLQKEKWIDVESLVDINNYPYDNTAVYTNKYSFKFDDIWGKAIRILGDPVNIEKNPDGNPQTYAFTTISEFETYYRTANTD